MYLSSVSERIAPVLKQLIEPPEVEQHAARVTHDCSFPEALAIVDATFQPTTKPQASFQSARSYFSYEHFDYGFKYQVLHARDERAIHVSGLHAGAVHDLEILKDSIEEVKQIIRDHKFQWAILADKGCTGANRLDVPFIIPAKLNAIGRDEENEAISDEWVICKNFYGRLKIRYALARDMFRGSWDLHKTRFENMIAQTNLNFQSQPLRRGENSDAEWLRKLVETQMEEGKMRWCMKTFNKMRSNERRKERELGNA